MVKFFNAMNNLGIAHFSLLLMLENTFSKLSYLFMLHLFINSTCVQDFYLRNLQHTTDFVFFTHFYFQLRLRKNITDDISF